MSPRDVGSPSHEDDERVVLLLVELRHRHVYGEQCQRGGVRVPEVCQVSVDFVQEDSGEGIDLLRRGLVRIRRPAFAWRLFTASPTTASSPALTAPDYRVLLASSRCHPGATAPRHHCTSSRCHPGTPVTPAPLSHCGIFRTGFRSCTNVVVCFVPVLTTPYISTVYCCTQSGTRTWTQLTPSQQRQGSLVPPHRSARSRVRQPHRRLFLGLLFLRLFEILEDVPAGVPPLTRPPSPLSLATIDDDSTPWIGTRTKTYLLSENFVTPALLFSGIFASSWGLALSTRSLEFLPMGSFAVLSMLTLGAECKIRVAVLFVLTTLGIREKVSLGEDESPKSRRDKPFRADSHALIPP